MWSSSCLGVRRGRPEEVRRTAEGGGKGREQRGDESSGERRGERKAEVGSGKGKGEKYESRGERGLERGGEQRPGTGWVDSQVHPPLQV